MKPRWMRRYVACPDCGLTFTEDTLASAMPGTLNDKRWETLEFKQGFNCPRCKAHYTHADFWQEQYEKWDREHVPQE